METSGGLTMTRGILSRYEVESAVVDAELRRAVKSHTDAIVLLRKSRPDDDEIEDRLERQRVEYRGRVAPIGDRRREIEARYFPGLDLGSETGIATEHHLWRYIHHLLSDAHRRAVDTLTLGDFGVGNPYYCTRLRRVQEILISLVRLAPAGGFRGFVPEETAIFTLRVIMGYMRELDRDPRAMPMWHGLPEKIGLVPTDEDIAARRRLVGPVPCRCPCETVFTLKPHVYRERIKRSRSGILYCSRYCPMMKRRSA